MTATRKMAAAFAAAVVVAQPQIAAAQEAQCLEDDEATAVIIYAMPRMVSVVRAQCASELPSSGFLANRADAFIAKYRGLESQYWPEAKTGILKIARKMAKTESDRRAIELMKQVPDTVLMSMLDEMFAGLAFHDDTQVTSCDQAEEIASLVDRIQPEVFGRLAGLIMPRFTKEWEGLPCT